MNAIVKFIIISVIIGIISYLVYRNNKIDNMEIPIVYPSTEPTKVKPKNHGGVSIANSNNIIYETFENNKKTRAVIFQSEPEKPLEIDRQKLQSKDDDIWESISEHKINTHETGLNVLKIPKQSLDNINRPKRGNYKLQLGSLKSETEAEIEAERIKKKYVKFLGESNISIVKSKSSNGIYFYLLLLGNYKTLSEAKAICKKLGDNEQGCIITNR